MNVHFVFGTENEASQTNSEGWFGFGMATVGIDPNTFEVLNGHPTKIPTDEILGGVVQNCHNAVIGWCVSRLIVC